MSNKLKRIEASLVRKIISLNKKFYLIRPNNKILIAVSGGKDSLSLVRLLKVLQKRVPFKFELEAVTLDIGIPDHIKQNLIDWIAEQDVKYEILPNNILETVNQVVPQGKLPCAACARFRRGILYNLAYDKKAILALGHHADDAMETLLLNIFYSGKIQTMPPSLLADDKRNRLIRPMMFCRESMIREYSELIAAPVINGCSCPASNMVQNSKRAKMKELIYDLESQNKEVGAHILRSLQNIKESNMMDEHLMNFNMLYTSWEKEKLSGKEIL